MYSSSWIIEWGYHSVTSVLGVSQGIPGSVRSLGKGSGSVGLLRNLADLATEIHIGREKPEHANIPIALTMRWWPDWLTN